MSYERFNDPVGLLKEATIIGYDDLTDTVKIHFTSTSAATGSKKLDINIPSTHTMFYNNGLFIGTKPKIGTPIIVGQGSGNRHYFVCFKAENIDKVPQVKDGELLIQATSDSKITLNTKNQIKIGSDNNYINIDLGLRNKTNLISFNFENENHFNQAYREIGGLVKRDLRLNKTGFDQDSKLEDDSYDSSYKIIGMDPTVTANDIITGPTKNPPLVEHRELIYEFQYQSNISNDLEESLKYGNSNKSATNYLLPNRRKSRGDVLSLTLLEPNYLMETIKGTVVDIFGNILDLNRIPLPIGKDTNTLKEISTDKVKAFSTIKELERKSLAFHFEINTKKDLNQKSSNNISTLDLLNINSNSDNSRLRSRFFIDIDKEGQFKINVPASSEKGNIPLLTRYENRSSYDTEDNNNPNKLLFDNNNLDIFLDSFATGKVSLGEKGFVYSKEKGSINIQDNKSEAAPIDRITNAHIKHGTAHHDILNTAWTLQTDKFINYQVGTNKNITVDISKIPLLENVVSNVIKVSGDGNFDNGGPNAGGRSGSINFDGMLEFNIGANTVDRQSLWMDLAGGSILNLGRDKNMRSAVIAADGDVIMQVGGIGIEGDSRFIKQNGFYGAVFDLRVTTQGGYTHMFRCDSNGVTIMSPGNVAIHAAGNLKLSSDSNIEMDAESVIIQQRLVNKVFGGSI